MLTRSEFLDIQAEDSYHALERAGRDIRALRALAADLKYALQHTLFSIENGETRETIAAFLREALEDSDQW